MADQHSVIATFGDSLAAPSPASSSQAMPPTPGTSQTTSVPTATSQKRKHDEMQGSRVDIIELSDSDDDESDSGPAKKRKTAPVGQVRPVVLSATASRSAAGPSRPSALSALKALAAQPAQRPVVIPEQDGEDQEPAVNGTCLSYCEISILTRVQMKSIRFSTLRLSAPTTIKDLLVSASRSYSCVSLKTCMTAMLSEF